MHQAIPRDVAAIIGVPIRSNVQTRFAGLISAMIRRRSARPREALASSRGIRVVSGARTLSARQTRCQATSLTPGISGVCPNHQDSSVGRACAPMPGAAARTTCVLRMDIDASGIPFGSKSDRDDWVDSKQVPLRVGDVERDLVVIAPLQETTVEKKVTGKKRRGRQDNRGCLCHPACRHARAHKVSHQARRLALKRHAD